MMPRPGILRSIVALGLALAGALALGAATLAQEPALEDAIEVQARGVVHEAFARPVDPTPGPGPLLAQQPPDPIAEEAPPEQPEGDNVQWFGGYWAWDAERNEFMWVSGTYRDAPAGQAFNPGYWAQEGEGWRWVPGFWTPDQPGQQLTYAPEPPQSLDTGPTVAAPGEDYVYTPGVWVLRETRFAWRPGYWMQPRPGFVWVHAHWNWTPAGYVFCPGFHDFPMERRGLLFAPVVFTRPVWQTPGWRFRPAHMVHTRPLLDHLFIGVGGRYCYGDWYASARLGRGFDSWAVAGPRMHDPLFRHYRHTNRHDPRWETNLRGAHQDRMAGRAPLPPRTLREQTTVVRNNVNTKVVNNITVVSPLSKVDRKEVRLTTAPPAKLQAQRQAADKVRQQQVVRQQVEQKLGGKTGAGKAIPSQKGTSSTPVTRPPAKNVNTTPSKNGNPAAKNVNTTPSKNGNPPAKKLDAPAKQPSQPAKKLDAPAKKTNPPAKQQNPPAKQQNPPAKQQNPPAKQQNPPAKQLDAPTKKQNSPTKQQNPPAKKTESPSKRVGMMEIRKGETPQAKKAQPKQVLRGQTPAAQKVSPTATTSQSAKSVGGPSGGTTAKQSAAPKKATAPTVRKPAVQQKPVATKSPAAKTAAPRTAAQQKPVAKKAPAAKTAAPKAAARRPAPAARSAPARSAVSSRPAASRPTPRTTPARPAAKGKNKK